MVMKKFMNDPADLTPELMEGYAAAFSNKVKLVNGKTVCRVVEKSADKVALVTLGGAGHEPALSGFVGEGMLDMSVVGDVFAAPGPPSVYMALKAAAEKHVGVLFIVLNHAGDVMSAKMAMDMLENDGLAGKVKVVTTHEDIAPGANTPDEDRRGLVGCIGVYKVAGAAAEAGKSLDEVAAIAERFNGQMATLSVALKTATHPSTGGAISELADDEMEIGMGQHGEAGTGRSKMMTADKTAEVMATQLIAAIGATEGDSVMLMINGSGATTLMEQFIVYRGTKNFLDTKGIKIGASCVGEYLTVQEMGGFQMFIAKLDDELQTLWDAPADTAYMTVR